jgi:6-phosphofructokinase 1
MGNAIVGQSGGPTSVINSSLAGVYESAIERGAGKVYGMLNGIQGFLEKRVIDLSLYLKNSLDIESLKRTPSSFLGSCRYKLPDPEDPASGYYIDGDNRVIVVDTINNNNVNDIKIVKSSSN